MTALGHQPTTMVRRRKMTTPTPRDVHADVLVGAAGSPVRTAAPSCRPSQPRSRWSHAVSPMGASTTSPREERRPHPGEHRPAPLGSLLSLFRFIARL